MERRSTLLLKIALFILAAPVLIFCIAMVPVIVKNIAEGLAGVDYAILGLVVIIYITAVPYYIALFQAWKLLSYIDANNAFSEQSVTALRIIKRSAIIISALYILALPLFYIFAEYDDAPGLIIIGLLLVFAAGVIAVFAAVLVRLLRQAIDIKTENDLTI